MVLVPRTLNLSKLHGTESERVEFAREALEGFSKDGFIKIVGHGIPVEEMSRLLEWNKQFFDLPLQQKLAVSNVPGPQPQRGYQAVGVEKTATLNINGEVNLNMASHEGKEDVKETFDMAGPHDIEYPNKWPTEDELPGFRSWMEAYYEKSHKVALEILGALELAMDLPRGSFVNLCGGCKGEMRMNYYPETSVAKLRADNVRRIWPHTDASSITLLVQDSNGGLEIEDQSTGAFEPLPLIDKAELIVNGGETLERWTNGRLKPGLHQVTVPSHFNDSTEKTVPYRCSVAYFQNADAEASMAPVNGILRNGDTSKYDDMTSRNYQRFRNSVVY